VKRKTRVSPGAAALPAERRDLARRGWAGEKSGLFEHPGLCERQFHLKVFNGVVCINRVFPQPANAKKRVTRIEQIRALDVYGSDSAQKKHLLINAKNSDGDVARVGVCHYDHDIRQ